ncbi:DNA-directed RNA polymerase sigma-70 factor [Dokdonia pacifica]|uniref:RNA polymerase sigma-70 factor, ECF subfamily n=1 Tax=Dokdonia pacifica TaxID=1627892 RepID=A0A239A7V6_9FLAO|nr:sigma-70 family RNA polymerase sigma factor [Dokdonia pacifica]GGG35454.1 DNA-directed RNA polymerase sigma-70 factor [Dokdonia pacifica]SNR91746.1 RNA polymerase sigma-70 factor, ECF subfamily [Dokdonia pacifica]
MRKEEAFTQLIKENEGIIFKISRVYCDTRENQKDLYQDIVFQLWKGFDSFRGEAKASTWMYRVALNTAFTFLRKEKRKGTAVGIENLHLTYEPDDPILEERLAEMYAQIRQLSDVNKGIILLLLEGKKYEEIATITGFSRSKVATRISRIKETLRTQLVKK